VARGHRVSAFVLSMKHLALGCPDFFLSSRSLSVNSCCLSHRQLVQAQTFSPRYQRDYLAPAPLYLVVRWAGLIGKNLLVELYLFSLAL